jgi:uncharacterized RDD family membrane protein YckC
MEKEERKGTGGSRARYVWDPNKLAWVETVEETPKEAHAGREEPVGREEVARQEKTVPQTKGVRQEVIAERGIEEIAPEEEVEAEAYEAEIDSGLLEYKGALLRLVAIVIDIIILAVVGVIISMIVRAVGPEQLPRAYGVINLFIGCAYFMGFWLWRGQTVGKMIIGAKVVRPDGSRIGLGNAALRYIFYFIPTFAPLLFVTGFFGVASWLQLVVPLISIIIIGLVAKKRGIHDLVAGTVVINTRSRAFQSRSTQDLETYESESEPNQQE